VNFLRPKFRAGYFQLLKYLGFVALYFAILYVQMSVNEVFQIDTVFALSPCDARFCFSQ
jgi:hypothetical protein